VLPRIELEVDARTNEVFGQADVASDAGTERADDAGGARGQASGCYAIEVRAAKINVEIFDLGSPVVGKGPLDASARRPAGLIVRLLQNLRARAMSPANYCRFGKSL